MRGVMPDPRTHENNWSIDASDGNPNAGPPALEKRSPVPYRVTFMCRSASTGSWVGDAASMFSSPWAHGRPDSEFSLPRTPRQRRHCAQPSGGAGGYNEICDSPKYSSSIPAHPITAFRSAPSQQI